MRLLEYSFYRHKATGKWVYGLAPGGGVELTDRMCDAGLYLGLSMAQEFPGKDYKREWVRIKAFEPPRVSTTKKKPAKSRKTKKAKAGGSKKAKQVVAMSETAESNV